MKLVASNISRCKKTAGFYSLIHEPHDPFRYFVILIDFLEQVVSHEKCAVEYSSNHVSLDFLFRLDRFIVNVYYCISD